MSSRPPRLKRARPPQALRRGAALYVAVTGTTMIVSVLGLSAMAIVRIERQQAMSMNARQIARSHARSGVELALQRINSDPSWRSNYTNGVETTVLSLGSGSTGSVSWSLTDTDGELDNSDGVLRLRGIGRIGSTVQVSSVEVRAGEVSGQLRGYESGSGADDLRNDKWWGQYFKPTLPANANGWVITSVQVRIRRDQTSRQFQVRLYGAGGGPLSVGTEIESTPVNSATVPSGPGWTWFTIPFAGSTVLEIGQAVSLTLETNSSQPPIDISYASGSVSAANSALLRGDGGDWDAFEPDKALHYRVHGAYTTSDNVAREAGTWDWDVP